MRAIKIPDFSFNSPLAKVVIEIERIRGDLGSGTTPEQVFIQLKQLFQLMTSIMSARIEGNRTSIVDIIDGAKDHPLPDRSGTARQDRTSLSDGVKEILLLEQASHFIDEHVRPGTPITHSFVRELHKIAVSGLEREGDRTPGAYRTTDVVIQGSGHTPPPAASIQADMQSLLDFINQETDRSFDLIKLAIAHHRFVWIHPFGNGNGRTCRLLTYAIMVSQGFTSTSQYRAIDPTAVFGADRAAYYKHLELADSLEDEATINWCTYLLSGIFEDLKKLDQLRDHNFVIQSLLHPALDRALATGATTKDEHAVLKVFAAKSVAKAGELGTAFSGSAVARSQLLRRMIEQRLIEPIAENKRSYQLVMAPGPLTPFILQQLDRLGFLPRILRDES